MVQQAVPLIFFSHGPAPQDLDRQPQHWLHGWLFGLVLVILVILVAYGPFESFQISAIPIIEALGPIINYQIINCQCMGP